MNIEIARGAIWLRDLYRPLLLDTVSTVVRKQHYKELVDSLAIISKEDFFMEKESKSLILAECGIMVAMSIVLSFVKVIDMPFGGSVTACSMLPVIIAAYRHGIKWGALAGFTYSIVQLLLGLSNVGYATSKVAMIAIIFLDYIIAFTCLGLVGFVNKNKNQTAALATGTFVVCIIRYLCHIISGCTVWAGVSIPTEEGLIYSIVYNGAYMIPETVVTVAAAWMISGVLDFRNSNIAIKNVKEQATLNSVSFIFIVIAVVVDFLLIFSTIQTEEGFDVTRIKMTNGGMIAIVSVVGIVMSVASNRLLGKRK